MHNGNDESPDDYPLTNPQLMPVNAQHFLMPHSGYVYRLSSSTSEMSSFLHNASLNSSSASSVRHSYYSSDSGFSIDGFDQTPQSLTSRSATHPYGKPRKPSLKFKGSLTSRDGAPTRLKRATDESHRIAKIAKKTPETRRANRVQSPRRPANTMVQSCSVPSLRNHSASWFFRRLGIDKYVWEVLVS